MPTDILEYGWFGLSAILIYFASRAVETYIKHKAIQDEHSKQLVVMTRQIIKVAEQQTKLTKILSNHINETNRFYSEYKETIIGTLSLELKRRVETNTITKEM